MEFRRTSVLRQVQIIFTLIFVSLLNPVQAETLPVENYDEVAVNTFWNELYNSGGWSLYCGYRFDQSNSGKEGRHFVIEQIYPSSWMLKSLDCASRQRCRADVNSRFTRMEADMHNLYPVWQEIDVIRRDTAFGIVSGEEWRYEDCDFEKKLNVSEPRPIARGNIARSIFYMHSEYGVPIDQEMLRILKEWNREDPPSNQELARNNRIEELQGNRNSYIDNPALAEQISSKWLANDP